MQLGRRVTERAQEMFLEYAHYLPERATLRIVQQMQSLAATELASLDLKAPVDAASLVDRMSKVHAGAGATASARRCKPDSLSGRAACSSHCKLHFQTGHQISMPIHLK